jgi:hypothetical protein
MSLVTINRELTILPHHSGRHGEPGDGIMRTTKSSYDTTTYGTATELLGVATSTIDGYLGEAIANIDRRFGEGYSREHPELVGASLRAAAQDFHTSIMNVRLEEIGEAIEQMRGSKGDGR